MSKEIDKVQPAGKTKSAMSAAVSGTEAIRTWDDHRIGTEALAARFSTDTKVGLTLAQAKEIAKSAG